MGGLVAAEMMTATMMIPEDGDPGGEEMILIRDDAGIPLGEMAEEGEENLPMTTLRIRTIRTTMTATMKKMMRTRETKFSAEGKSR